MMQLYQQAKAGGIDRRYVQHIEYDAHLPSHLHGESQQRQRSPGDNPAATPQYNFISLSMYEDR